MNLHAGYFALSPSLNPFYLFDKWLNPMRHQRVIRFRGQALTVGWTERAQRAMLQRSQPLVVEMQLYFSCVVKKRVLFHDRSDLPLTDITPSLQVAFRAVQSTSCDPVTFARDYPVKRTFDTPAAERLHPKWLKIDYQDKDFSGEFGV